MVSTISEETFKSEINQMTERIYTQYKNNAYENRIEFCEKDENRIKDRIFEAVCSAYLIKTCIIDEIETKDNEASFVSLLLSVPFSKFGEGRVLDAYYKDIVVSMARAFELINREMPEILINNEMCLLSERIFIHGLVYYVNKEDIKNYTQLLLLDCDFTSFTTV